MSGVWLGHDGDKVIKFGVNAQGGALFFLRWLKQTIGWDVAHHFFPPLECDYDWIHMWTSGGVSSHPTWLFSIVLKLCHCSTTMKTGPLVETCKLKDKAATLQSVVYHHSPGCCLIVVDGKIFYIWWARKVKKTKYCTRHCTSLWWTSMVIACVVCAYFFWSSKMGVTLKKYKICF